MKKIVVFQHINIMQKHHLSKVEMEFDVDATDEKINVAYEKWVWSIMGDHFTWFEKEF